MIRWLPRIPDYIITKIPDIVFNPDLPIPRPIPDPVNPPRPQPDPAPFAGGDFDDIFKAADIKEEKEKFGKFATHEKAYSTSRQILNDSKITSRLLSYDPSQIRNVIRNNFDLFHPLFCYTPWIWPYFYRCDELAVVYTDMNGLFETEVDYWLLGDKPDLYFWVEAFINGVWTTVYKSPLSCNTYWDYECGKQIPIDVTDPRVQWGCETVLEGEMIWVKTIGHGTSVHHIQQHNGSGPPVQGTTHMNRIGLTDKHEPTGNFRRPFGARLYFLLQFSSALPKNQFTYYRWSYKKIKNADLSNAVSTRKTLNNPMHKPYTFEYIGSGGHFHFDVNHFKMGPVSQGGTKDLYRIPPPSPYDAPVNATERNAHWDQNTRSIAFDSELEGDGLYEFTLELFDDSGNKITDIPNEFFQIPDYYDFSPSIDAPNRYLSNPGGGMCDAFKMVMRIDNSDCEAEIYKLKVDGTPASPGCCGFVTYKGSPDLELSFRAFHPNNFADFDFKVKKGTCTDSAQTALTNADGMVISSVDGYTRSPASIFSKDLKPDQLLGICSDEGKAAFAEHLHVHALATNGNHNLDRFNASTLAAFALEPDN